MDRNYGPFFVPSYFTAPSIQGTHKGTILLTTTHMAKIHYKYRHELAPFFWVHVHLRRLDIGLKFYVGTLMYVNVNLPNAML